jgi:hypothetical protein
MKFKVGASSADLFILPEMLVRIMIRKLTLVAF